MLFIIDYPRKSVHTVLKYPRKNVTGADMDRLIFQRLDEWRTKKERKPLILKGARRAGKRF